VKRIRTIVGLSVSAMALVVMTAPAFAHVEVSPEEAPKGGELKLTFTVPNEEASADTVKVDVKFPDDHPIASVSVEPHDGGWTAQVITKPLATPITTDDGTVTEAVSEVVWSGGTIPPGDFDEFSVLAGPLPDDVDSIKFPTVQSYSDGTDVSWIQDTVAGQPEPDHPAPVLKLTAASTDTTPSSSGSSASSASSSASGAAAPTVTTTATDDNKGIAIVGVVLGALALITAIAALVSARRTPS
jgi:uncharacterized protein YcnI